MAGGDNKGAVPMQSVVTILIRAVRDQAVAIIGVEKVRADGADEFTQARANRDMVKAARAALDAADMAERLQRAALAGLPPSLTVANTDHPSPPDEPPPQAA